MLLRCLGAAAFRGHERIAVLLLPEFLESGNKHAMSTLAHTQPKAVGAGGRASVSGVVATVFGATGFLGRYIVQQLARIGSQVVIPYRGVDDEIRHLKLMGDLGQVVPIRYSLRNDDLLQATFARSNVVINLLGRDHETRNFSFEDVNVKAAERLAKLAAEKGTIARFVHLSCLGASPNAKSKQLRTKHAGEQAVLEHFPSATILRPADMFGTEDRLLNQIARWSKKLPAVPLFDGGGTKLQPVSVLDVAAAAVAALRDEGTSCGKVYHLAGPEVLSLKHIAERVFETIREDPTVINVPLAFAKLVATPLDWLVPRAPFPVPQPDMATLDYFMSLGEDKVLPPNVLGLEDLGIKPRRMIGLDIDYLFSYRAGGPQMGTTAGERIAGAGFESKSPSH